MQISNVAWMVYNDIGHYHFSHYVFTVYSGKQDAPQWNYFSAYKNALEHETDLINVL